MTKRKITPVRRRQNVAPKKARRTATRRKTSAKKRKSKTVKVKAKAKKRKAPVKVKATKKRKSPIKKAPTKKRKAPVKKAPTKKRKAPIKKAPTKKRKSPVKVKATKKRKAPVKVKAPTKKTRDEAAQLKAKSAKAAKLAARKAAELAAQKHQASLERKRARYKEKRLEEKRLEAKRQALAEKRRTALKNRRAKYVSPGGGGTGRITPGPKWDPKTRKFLKDPEPTSKEIAQAEVFLSIIKNAHPKETSMMSVVVNGNNTVDAELKFLTIPKDIKKFLISLEYVYEVNLPNALKDWWFSILFFMARQRSADPEIEDRYEKFRNASVLPVNVVLRGSESTSTFAGARYIANRVAVRGEFAIVGLLIRLQKANLRTRYKRKKWKKLR